EGPSAHTLNPLPTCGSRPQVTKFQNSHSPSGACTNRRSQALADSPRRKARNRHSPFRLSSPACESEQVPPAPLHWPGLVSLPHRPAFESCRSFHSRLSETKNGQPPLRSEVGHPAELSYAFEGSCSRSSPRF